jgi:hypothetical protein
MPISAAISRIARFRAAGTCIVQLYHFGKACLPFQIVGSGLEFAAKKFLRRLRCMRPELRRKRPHRQPAARNRHHHDDTT